MNPEEGRIDREEAQARAEETTPKSRKKVKEEIKDDEL